MTEKKEYTIHLSPGGKTRYIAGPYDKKNHIPLYTYDILIPPDAKQDVKMNQFLRPSGNEYEWVYEFHNTSPDYTVHIRVYKDGVLIPIVL